MRGLPDLVDPNLDALLDEVYGLAEDDPEAALAMLDDASETWPDHPELLFARGELEWTLHGPEAAEPHYRRAVALAPTSPTPATRSGRSSACSARSRR
jgi:tetratricopeptide (TPR) repeat protein